MKYRREIDGLRAVAVLPVILFHAGFKVFEGGYVGVDVFFVISGYLITTIILSDMNNGRFSIILFYERRARRILPALFFVILCCLPFAWLWLLPSHLKDFSESVLAVIGFSSNVLFWMESGYFGTASELKPLLHTWSLAVEEQYYILFPIFLMFLWKLRKRWIFSALIVVGVSSLLLSQWGAHNKPSANFFLLPSRVWELAIGALIAFYFIYKKEHADFVASLKRTSDFLGLIGLGLIAYSIFIFDKTTPFPSLYALLPTVGAGLIIIFSTSETIVGRILSVKPMVGIGLVSYSAYLWHQPIFVFARHRSLSEPSTTLLLFLSVLSILMACLSWRFVEMPFRDKKAFDRKAIFGFAAAGSFFLAATGLAGHMGEGFGGRVTNFGDTFASIEGKLEINHGLSSDCDDNFTLSPECRTSDDPEVLLWGDSYAMHLAQGIVASKPSVKMIQMTKSACGPILDVAPVLPNLPSDWSQECLEFNNTVRKWLATNNSIKYAILSSPFTQYFGDNKIIVDGVLTESDRTLLTKRFLSTLSELEEIGITPIVFSAPPKNGYNIGECLSRHSVAGSDLKNCDFNINDMDEEASVVLRFLSEISHDYQVVNLDQYLCRDNICRTSYGSVFIYRDIGHLSHEGSAFLGQEMGFYDLIVGNNSEATTIVRK